MKKILTLGFGVFLMTQITAQNSGFSTSTGQSTGTNKSTVTTTNTVTNSNTTVVSEGNKTSEKPGTIDYLLKNGKPYAGNNDKKVVAKIIINANTASTVESDKSSNSTTLAISLPGFEEVVNDINVLLNNYSTSTTKSDDKLKIKKLASKYENMLNAELKKNKSLIETQKTDIQNQIIIIQTYK